MSRTEQTIKELLYQREYKIIEDSEDKILAIHENGDKICVFMQPILKVNIDRIKEFVSILNTLKYNHCIIIYLNDITPMAKNFVKMSIEIEMEVFKEMELQYNITKHRLVPKHERLVESEAKEFKKKFGDKLPKMFATEAVSRFYNYKRHDIIKITRDAENSFVSFRIVV